MKDLVIEVQNKLADIEKLQEQAITYLMLADDRLRDTRVKLDEAKKFLEQLLDKVQGEK